MEATTYSFLDLSGAIAHPSVGPYTFTGEGVGQVDVVMETDNTVHDVAADGSVMVSKVAGNNGRIVVHCQQTSKVHKWLLAWYNYLKFVAPVSEWAQTAAFLKNTADGTSHVITGMSPTKNPDKTYQKQGQMIVWTLVAADIHSVAV